MVSLFVDGTNPAASDGNPGTEALPFLTLAHGCQEALAQAKAGVAATLVVKAGTYREAVALSADGTNAELIVQAEGEVVVAGSDLWTGWQSVGGSVFTHPWPFQWGLAPLPPRWPTDVPDLVRRREMVFAAGVPLAQALQGPASPGQFVVDEAGATLQVNLGGADPNGLAMEVATRAALWRSDGVADLSLVGVTFRHSADPLDAAAVAVSNSQRASFESCAMLFNNWGGLAAAAGGAGTLVRACRANRNGARGMSAYLSSDAAFEDCETSRNGWRSLPLAQAHFGWAAAGIKCLLMTRARYVRHRSAGNLAHGWWIDTGNRDIVVVGGAATGNLLAGWFVEASPGPVDLDGAVARFNAVDGINVSGSQQVTLRGVDASANGADGIRVAASDVTVL